MANSLTPVGPSPFLKGFDLFDFTTRAKTTLRFAIAGEGPPLLLLHGHPQTHVTWRKVAPTLARHFTVIAADLRGYGDSSKPSGGDDHINYSKRVMARDQVELMQALGFERFFVAGHDRGARVAHRMALDHPDAVARVALLDIAPTATMYARTDRVFATRYFWWFFFIQPYPLPERLIGNDPEFFLRAHLGRQNGPADATEPEIFSEYLRCYRDPMTQHAVCEDYRASAGIDLVHDAADDHKRIAAPLLAMWGARSTVGALYDVEQTWLEKALDVKGRALDCGHNLQEECPALVAEELFSFFMS
ncbi:alpha/beta hydrolase [Mesorhizobium sp. 1M-11]|uniref:alpha/beta fold hydrolase n=1 Tax=Mesorhizobium sp. 1M-11 TaxID=1529006 RepID=UPI001FCDACF0|nr:alpha/beta hydrolase [Mesorhizobium sp. 1M-11]